MAVEQKFYLVADAQVQTSAEKEKPGVSLLPETKKTIWAVGGGKGGTGKSFISTSLAIELASQEGDVVAIDADLGGPNLHTLLGVKEAALDLGDFVNNKVSQLKEIVLPTSFLGLRLIKGTENFLFMANLNHFKKLKFIRQIKTLDAKRIIIDIGTGSSFNTIDFFVFSNPGILVVNPEPTSIENTYYFVKSCIYRILKLYMDYYKIEEFKKKLAEQVGNNSQSLYYFFNTLLSHNKSQAHLLYKALKNFRPCLILNKATGEKDLILGQSIAQVVQKYLLVDLNFLGIVPFDKRVPQSIQNFTPFLTQYPDSPASQAIKSITDKLVNSVNHIPF
jgi:flagellar biosynthesis protein FlhG